MTGRAPADAPSTLLRIAVRVVVGSAEQLGRGPLGFVELELLAARF
jgi:hypothetical protein